MSVDANRAPATKLIIARQHTAVQNEEHYLDVAPGQRKISENKMYDIYAQGIIVSCDILLLFNPLSYYRVIDYFSHF